MMFTAPDPVPSGRVFDVVAVHGRTPHVMEDFVGDTVFTVQWLGYDRVVSGNGYSDGGTVRFTEKDVANGGKDVRVWLVSTARQGRFVARTGR